MLLIHFLYLILKHKKHEALIWQKLLIYYSQFNFMNMNVNLFNHNNNSADVYVQLNSCGCWIVRLNQHLKLSNRQSEKAEWKKEHENI